MACHSYLCTSPPFALPFGQAHQKCISPFLCLGSNFSFFSAHLGEPSLTPSQLDNLSFLCHVIVLFSFLHLTDIPSPVGSSWNWGCFCWSLLYLQCLEPSDCSVNFC